MTKLYIYIAKRISLAITALNYFNNLRLIKEGKLGFGRYSYGLHNIKVRTFQGNDVKISIGDFVSISSNCELITGGIHPINKITTFPLTERFLRTPYKTIDMPTTKGPIIIGSDVWIASNVTILSGVKIGDGAVISAGSIVTKDVPPYAVVAGVPAKIVKFRFSNEQIERLLEIKWWEWTYDQIEKEVQLISSDNIIDFIKKYGNEKV